MSLLDIDLKKFQESLIDLDQNLFPPSLIAPSTTASLPSILSLLQTAQSQMTPGSLLAKDGYDLEPTMAGFELNDPKMDLQFGQDEAFHPSKFSLKELTDQELVGILNESLCHEANLWQGKNVFGNIYSFAPFSKKEFLKQNPVISALGDYLLFMNFYMVDLARTTTCL